MGGQERGVQAGGEAPFQEGAREKDWEEDQREGSLKQEGGSQSQVSTELLSLLLFFV